MEDQLQQLHTDEETSMVSMQTACAMYGDSVHAYIDLCIRDHLWEFIV